MWTQHAKKAFLTVSLLGMVLMAGCTSEDDVENEAPVAVLEVTDDTGKTGDAFTFDGQDSHDPDGEVVLWRFDFGDGQSVEASDEDAARVKHTYAEGGEYTVTLTVTDDGDEQAGAKTATADVRVAVNQEFPVAETPVYASPLPNQTETSSTPFVANAGADRFELKLDVQSVIAAGSSEVTIQVIDPEEDVIEEETVTVPAGETVPVDMEGIITQQGEHEVRIIAQSGGATAAGDLLVVYDDDF